MLSAAFVLLCLFSIAAVYMANKVEYISHQFRIFVFFFDLLLSLADFDCFIVYNSWRMNILYTLTYFCIRGIITTISSVAINMQVRPAVTYGILLAH